MAHGTKPYGRTSHLETVYGVQDMGELAVRLWSPDLYDRRGNVLFMDSFEAGIMKWDGVGVGAGAARAWDGQRAKTGGFSMLLTTGAGAGGNYIVWHYEPFPRLSDIGAEFSFHPTATIGIIQWTVRLYDGANFFQFGARYNCATGVLDYWVPGVGYVNANLPYTLAIADTLWHTIKVVADYANNTYVRLLCDNYQLNLAGVPIAGVASGLGPYLQAEIVVFSAVAGNQNCWVDDVIVTQNDI